jgi:hypothetical protein
MIGWIVIRKGSDDVLESAILNRGCMIIHLTEESAVSWFEDGIAASRKKDYEIVEVEIFGNDKI